jgi:hypothetical protein
MAQSYPDLILKSYSAKFRAYCHTSAASQHQQLCRHPRQGRRQQWGGQGSSPSYRYRVHGASLEALLRFLAYINNVERASILQWFSSAPSKFFSCSVPGPRRSCVARCGNHSPTVTTRGGPTGGSGWALAHPKPGPLGTPPVRPPNAPSNFHVPTSTIRSFSFPFSLLCFWRLESWRLETWRLATAGV